jgi:hypothetical protein
MVNSREVFNFVESQSRRPRNCLSRYLFFISFALLLFLLSPPLLSQH